MKINSYHSAGSTYPKLKPQKTINISDVEWIGFRFLDNISKTFKYNNKYYKAIYPNAMEYTLNLFKSGIIDGLIEKKIIPETTITNYTIDKFPLVLMQETEFFNIDSINWNPLMLKDAAKKVIDLQNF